MRGRGHLRHLAEHLHVGRRLIEVVVADQAAERLAAKLPVFGFVDFLEERTLIPGGALEAFQGLPEIGLADVHEANLQHLVGLGVVDEIVQSAPRAFELLKIVMVQDQVDLLRELLVELRDDGFD